MRIVGLSRPRATPVLIAAGDVRVMFGKDPTVTRLVANGPSFTASSAGSIPVASHARPTVTALRDGSLLVIAIGEAERYDPATAPSKLPAMRCGPTSHTATALADRSVLPLAIVGSAARRGRDDAHLAAAIGRRLGLPVAVKVARRSHRALRLLRPDPMFGDADLLVADDVC
jgi:hypothetical protein